MTASSSDFQRVIKFFSVDEQSCFVFNFDLLYNLLLGSKRYDDLPNGFTHYHGAQ